MNINVNMPVPKKTYTAPKLTPFGDLRTLTQGGSGALTEGAAMTALMRKP
jgi:hypothetical protein